MYIAQLRHSSALCPNLNRNESSARFDGRSAFREHPPRSVRGALEQIGPGARGEQCGVGGVADRVARCVLGDFDEACLRQLEGAGDLSFLDCRVEPGTARGISDGLDCKPPVRGPPRLETGTVRLVAGGDAASGEILVPGDSPGSQGD